MNNQNNEEKWRAEALEWWVNFPGSPLVNPGQGVEYLAWQETHIKAYLAARKKAQEELRHWTEVHGRIVSGLVEDEKQLMSTYGEKIVLLKAENERVRDQANVFDKTNRKLNTENRKLRELLERAKPFAIHCGINIVGRSESQQWLKDYEEVMK